MCQLLAKGLNCIDYYQLACYDEKEKYIISSVLLCLFDASRFCANSYRTG
jgi:hypothetical protein